MDTKNIKKVAPKARVAFMEAVSNRLNDLGLYADKEPAEVTQSGSVFQVNGRSFDNTILASRNRLKDKVDQKGFLAVTEEVAYTWFNRFCAIRYMELHDDFFEHGIRLLSHPNQPHGFEAIDKAVDLAKELEVSASELDQISDMKMAGDQDEAIYRQLLLAQCHYLHKAMPFMFEAINDESELLLPENLTRTDSIIRPLIDDIPEEDWEAIEVIGWLYQFYISEKKDEVIGKVVKSEDIPAATQLFTPNWIVKYLVQNSLGAKWLASYPDSEIKSEMEYYIEPAEQSEEVKQQLASITPDTLNIEKITLIDPACGSGHILVEAYELFKAIYQTQGYRARDIPQLILEKNLFGLDIDDRAAQLSSFALMMKAREDDRRIFGRGVKLKVLSMQESSHLNLDSLWQSLNLNGEWKKGTSQGLFDEKQIEVGSDESDTRYQLLKRILERFIQAKTFGSLIDIPSDELAEINELLVELEQLAEAGDTMQMPVSRQLIPFIKQAQILAQKYDAVVANPPYMGGKGMNSELKKFANSSYPNSKSDLFAVFIERGFLWLKDAAYNSMVTMQSWMFLSSYNNMRERILNNYTIKNMIHMGNGVMKIAFGTNATVYRNIHLSNYKGSFSYIEKDDINKQGVPFEFPVKNERLKTAAADDFKKIPGSPIAYWVSQNIRELFTTFSPLGKYSKPRQGMASSDDKRFVRCWYEVSAKFSIYNCINRESAKESLKKWFPYDKGGSYRKWYGNNEFVINWEFDGKEVLEYAASLYGSPTRTIKSISQYFSEGITWTAITSGKLSVRYTSEGHIFSNAGMKVFNGVHKQLLFNLGFLNSKVSEYLVISLSQTLNFDQGIITRLPIIDIFENEKLIEKLTLSSKEDWDSFESSWNFQTSPLTLSGNSLADSYNNWSHQNEIKISKIKRLEGENNNLFINAYGVQNELNFNVPLEQITLMINPRYRYGTKLADNELVNRFQSDTLSELISYSIGCMMGRYSLDREGLVYAHSSNEGFAELEADGAYKTFPADDDGIIPLTDESWFDDDATSRFKEFLIAVWGQETLEENLQFVADSLCLYVLKPKKTESPLETIRRYFSTGFYKQHLKTYKKRPIYWLFSSGKQKAFECLVYLHRYNEATLSRMRTEYVTPLLGKFEAQQRHMSDQINNASSTAEANKHKKLLTALEKKQSELREFDDKLKHYADMQIKLDLDDGVKVNYGKFGDLLANVKEVTGIKPVVRG